MGAPDSELGEEFLDLRPGGIFDVGDDQVLVGGEAKIALVDAGDFPQTAAQSVVCGVLHPAV